MLWIADQSSSALGRMFIARLHRRALAFLGFWVRSAPCDTPRIGTVADHLASPNRVAPRVDRCGWVRNCRTARQGGCSRQAEFHYILDRSPVGRACEMSEGRVGRRLAAILAVDVAGYSRLDPLANASARQCSSVATLTPTSRDTCSTEGAPRFRSYPGDNFSDTGGCDRGVIG
jgi:hypothetical protein